MFISHVEKVEVRCSNDFSGIIQKFECDGFYLHQIVPLNDHCHENWEGNGDHATCGVGYSYTGSALFVFRKEMHKGGLKISRF